MRKPWPKDAVPVDPLRERYLHLEEREGLRISHVAERLGMYDDKGKPNTTTVKRYLGLKPWSGSTNLVPYVRYDTAVKLCDALHIDYVDVGV